MAINKPPVEYDVLAVHSPSFRFLYLAEMMIRQYCDMFFRLVDRFNRKNELNIAWSSRLQETRSIPLKKFREVFQVLVDTLNGSFGTPERFDLTRCFFYDVSHYSHDSCVFASSFVNNCDFAWYFQCFPDFSPRFPMVLILPFLTQGTEPDDIATPLDELCATMVTPWIVGGLEMFGIRLRILFGDVNGWYLS